MQSTYLEKLEFNKIKNILSEFAISENGKEMCLNLEPYSNKYKI